MEKIMYDWILKRILNKKKKTCIIGISGVQGCGKSTSSLKIQKLLTRGSSNYSVLVFSLDDFYYTHHQQHQLSLTYPENPYLQYRGNPGSHDLLLLKNILKACLNENEKNLSIPRYNKAAFQGRGDRKSKEEWPTVAKPVDVILLEGWCLGFSSYPDTHVFT